MRSWLLGFVVFVLLACPRLSFAQSGSQNPLVGAWERVSLTNAQGVVTQPPGPASFLVFTADGFFSNSTIPADRPKVKTPIDQMTKEELLARFKSVGATHGTYTITGKTLTQKFVAHTDPTVEGTEAVREFRVEGDTLILSSPVSTNKSEARFRRARKQ
jgi:hypothetical protein